MTDEQRKLDTQQIIADEYNRCALKKAICKKHNDSREVRQILLNAGYEKSDWFIIALLRGGVCWRIWAMDAKLEKPNDKRLHVIADLLVALDAFDYPKGD